MSFKAVIFDIGGVIHASPFVAISAFEKEHGLPHNYINCSLACRGAQGAWQRFERGQLPLFQFYELFGKELSDVVNGNQWYTEYCLKRRIEVNVASLPRSLHIDGRELFGRMMRESNAFDPVMVDVVRRIRASGKWRVIALTNNFAKSEESIMVHAPPGVTVESEMKFLGWGRGATPPELVALFDDFCDSSTLGMRKPDPAFYLLACKRNRVKPEDCIFLDDIGANLKAAKALGMTTIHVPIGGSHAAVKRLEELLNTSLTGEVKL